MAFTEQQFKDLFSALTSHANTLGLFESVQGHEVVNGPRGLAVSYWCGKFRPPPAGSGLAQTSMVLDVSCRVYYPAEKPADDLEIRVLYAVSQLMNAFNGDFTLGGTIRAIDLQGMAGQAMDADWGWAEIGDAWYRVANIALPLIINDFFEQVA